MHADLHHFIQIPGWKPVTMEQFSIGHVQVKKKTGSWWIYCFKSEFYTHYFYQLYAVVLWFRLQGSLSDTTYRRTGFICENLIITNCEDSQTYSINSPPLCAMCADAISKLVKERSFVWQTGSLQKVGDVETRLKVSTSYLDRTIIICNYVAWAYP